MLIATSTTGSPGVRGDDLRRVDGAPAPGANAARNGGPGLAAVVRALRLPGDAVGGREDGADPHAGRAFLAELRRKTAERSLQHVSAATAIAAVPAVLVFTATRHRHDDGARRDPGRGARRGRGARCGTSASSPLTAIVLIFGALQLGLVTGVPDPAADGRSPTRRTTRSGAGTTAAGRDRDRRRRPHRPGYLDGTQTNLDFVPEQHTDFIFTVVGEEFGFAARSTCCWRLACSLWRAFRIGDVSKDPFGTYVAAGIARCSRSRSS